MISVILFAWILFQLQAPAWCYALVAAGLILTIIEYGVKMYKLGGGR